MAAFPQACLADYTIAAELGRGSYGVVHKATRKRDKKQCVVKKVALQTFKTDKQKAQALNEAKIMNNLSCLHVVAYLDAFIDDGMLYISLEFCDGGDLKSHLKKRPKPIEERRCWRLILHITLGLAYLHSRRILHRDMKSENVLLHSQPEDGVRIADLGLSKMLTNTASGAETLCGTPRYLSPEEATGKGRYNEKSDIWALGVIHYELLSERHRGPFDEATKIDQLLRMIVNNDPPQLPDGLDEGLVFVMRELMLKDCKLRPLLKDLLTLEVVTDAASKHDVDLEHDGPPVTAQTTLRTMPSMGALKSDPKPTAVPGLCARVCSVFGGAPPEVDNGVSRVEMSGAISVTAMNSFRPTMIGEAEDLRSRPAAIAIGNKAHVWDPVRGGGGDRPVWTAGENIQFGGLGWAGLEADDGSTVASFGLPDVFWYMENDGKAEIELRRLDDGKLVDKVALPTLKAEEKAPDVNPSVRPVSKPRSKSGAGSQLKPGTADNVSMVASGGPLLALAIHEDASIAIVIIHIVDGSVAGRCTSETRITALAVQASRHGDPRPSCVAAGTEDSHVKVWGIPFMKDGNMQCQLIADLVPGGGPGPPVSSLCFGAAACFLVAASNHEEEAMCVVWRRASRGKSVDDTFKVNKSKEFFDDYRGQGPASLYCDGNLLAYVQGPQEVRTKDHGVALWDLTQGRWERSFFKRGHHVCALALCGDALVTSDGLQAACTIQMWQASTGDALKSFQNPYGAHLLCVVEHVMHDQDGPAD